MKLALSPSARLVSITDIIVVTKLIALGGRDCHRSHRTTASSWGTSALASPPPECLQSLVRSLPSDLCIERVEGVK